MGANKVGKMRWFIIIVCVLAGCDKRTPWERFRDDMIIVAAVAAHKAATAAEEGNHCQESQDVTKVTVEEVRIDGLVTTVKNNGAGIGAGIGAIGAGVAAVATGGIAPAVATIGGGAVGGFVGKEAGTQTVASGAKTCAFRVYLNNTILVWSGENNWSNEHRFAKCSMLHPGDQIEVVKSKWCTESGNTLTSTSWRSGDTEGALR